MPNQEERPVEFWLNKIKVYWALHGGLENWDVHKGFNPCSFCRYKKDLTSSCEAKEQLRVRPDLSEMFVEIRSGLHRRETWCAEWIKDV